MGSIGNSNQNTLPPFGTYKDCSQGICTIYCPQWCYIVFPPPPPPSISFYEDATTDFSPLIIAIIGILAGAFILVSYYTLISKYCRRTNQFNNSTLEENDQLPTSNNNMHGQAWRSSGLDESVIRSITVAKYKSGDGLIEGTDCSVCLSEFQEDDSLRLLPKCNHAFHISCIDTWLKSHASCPLCRANIVTTQLLQARDQDIGSNNNGGTITNVSRVDQLHHRASEASIVISEAVGGGQVGPLIVKRSTSLSSSSSSSSSNSCIIDNCQDQEAMVVSVGDILRVDGEDKMVTAIMRN